MCPSSSPLAVTLTCVVVALLATPPIAASQDAPPDAYTAYPADRSPEYKSGATARERCVYNALGIAYQRQPGVQVGW
jgi:hypothetical protein